MVRARETPYLVDERVSVMLNVLDDVPKLGGWLQSLLLEVVHCRPMVDPVTAILL
jgi:hypothetical protein